MAEQASEARDRDLNQLRSRVAELEAEIERRNLRDKASTLESNLSGSGTTASSPPTSSGRRRTSGVSTAVADFPASLIDATERSTDVASRVLDEGFRVFRALTLSSLQSASVISDTVTTFVDDVLERNRPDGEAPVRDLVVNLPLHIQESARAAADRLRDDAQRRNPIDTFYDTYREARPSRRSRSTIRELSVVSTSPPNGWTGPAPANVTVVFSREIEPADGDFREAIVVKKGDRTVRGAVTHPDVDTLVWTPAAALDEGAYMASVSNIQSPADRSVVRMRQPVVFSFTVTAAT
jgi:hypothetical protein